MNLLVDTLGITVAYEEYKLPCVGKFFVLFGSWL
jgi:hypothetical protein